MSSLEENHDDNEDDDGFGKLKFLNHSDLIEYYNKTKQYLLSEDVTADGDHSDCNNDRDDHDLAGDNNNNNNDSVEKMFSLQYLQPRHLKSMVRCVLNNPDGTRTRARRPKSTPTASATTPTPTKPAAIVSRVDLQQRLRLIELRQRWKMTRRLLFGNVENSDSNSNINEYGNCNSHGDSHDKDSNEQEWWNNDVLAQRAAPGFLQRIEDYGHQIGCFDRHRYRHRRRHPSQSTNSSGAGAGAVGTKKHNQNQKEKQVVHVVLEEGNPKKFLSRLASGRTYKGDFRALLEDYNNNNINDNSNSSIDNSNNSDDLISLYDEIIGDKGGGGGSTTITTATQLFSKGEDHRKHEFECELELLRLFVDELEEASNNHHGVDGNDNDNDDNDDNDNDNDDDSKSTKGIDPLPLTPIVVNKEQITLMRAICDLDGFLNPPPLKSKSYVDDNSAAIHNSNSSNDGGRSVGKRGERDLKTFLVKRHGAATTTTTATNSTSESMNSLSSSKLVLSPVWVRPKSKSRRNLKERCRYVLEIPSSAKNNKKKSNTAVSSGTTSEYDAMVVFVRPVAAGNTKDKFKANNGNGNGRPGNNGGEDNTPLPPVMAIGEVWDAKATLDPSALLDVLEKKVLSLQRILMHEDSRVVNLGAYPRTDPHAHAHAAGSSSIGNEIAAEGANFVILPHSKDAKYASTTNTSTISPMVYRVGIESMHGNAEENCNSNNNNKNHASNGYNGLPQIGVFASQMIGPRAGARRIQTMVYQRLLETDLETVKNVVLSNSNRSSNRNSNSNIHCRQDGNGTVADYLRFRTNQLVREDSLEMMERILRLIHDVRPIVVVGKLPSNT